MSSGQVLKADKDFTKEVDQLLPEAEKLGQVGSAALLLLLELMEPHRATPKLRSRSCWCSKSKPAKYVSHHVRIPHGLLTRIGF